MVGISQAVSCLLLLVAVIVAAPAQARAQEAFKAFKQLDSTAKMPKLNAFSPSFGDAPSQPAARSIRMEARLTTDGAAMQQGLAWRVFSPIPGPDGKLPLIASAEGGPAEFQLTPGEYFVNVAFGRAGATKKLTVPEKGELGSQVMVLDAGGLLLNAVSGGDGRIPLKDLKFSIYAGEGAEDADRALVMADVKPNTVVRLSAGTYHVVSEYGDVNSVVRADIRIEPGKLTEATIQHRAAQINLKLVSEAGGEAIADTAWSVVTTAGEIVAESVSAFPQMVLNEGDYTAIARNKDKIYQKDFHVAAGRASDVELLLTK